MPGRASRGPSVGAFVLTLAGASVLALLVHALIAYAGGSFGLALGAAILVFCSTVAAGDYA